MKRMPCQFKFTRGRVQLIFQDLNNTVDLVYILAADQIIHDHVISVMFIFATSGFNHFKYERSPPVLPVYPFVNLSI